VRFFLFLLVYHAFIVVADTTVAREETENVINETKSQSTSFGLLLSFAESLCKNTELNTKLMSLNEMQALKQARLITLKNNAEVHRAAVERCVTLPSFGKFVNI
jgi:hypothetical protein